MSAAAAPARCQVERFRAVLSQRLGLQFDDSRCDHLGAVLRRRLARLDMAVEHYLCALTDGAPPAEPGALAEELTVGETYFFRNSEQFRALVEIVVPARMRDAARVGRRLSILSAGCASGEEAYSLAIALRESLPDAASQVELRAVDLNPAALAKAARARYLPWALRETPADIRRRWFRPAGRELVPAPELRASIRFENRNLASDDAALWQPQTFDVVFCRNVIMYFTPEQAVAVLARLARSLRPGGYLFLGHAETLRGLSEDFDLRQSHNTFYYQRKDAAPAAPRRRQEAPSACAPPPATADPASADGDWITAIRGAGDRASALAAAIQPPQRPAPTPAGSPDLAAALDLLRGERFSEARALLGRLPSPSAHNPDVLLLTATMLAHEGKPTAAEETCRQLLSLDPRNAGAHYVLALCREAAGEVAGAAEHDRIATYLDSSFAMPRLHLGLLARRSGNRDAARRELGQALVLLPREDPTRLLMFGGGFGRAALVSLCAAALRDCGGSR